MIKALEQLDFIQASFGDKDLEYHQFLKYPNPKLLPAIIGEQTHSNQYKFISNINQTFEIVPTVDALITNQKGITLMVKTADCVPILIASKDPIMISAIHSGRDGTKKNIVGQVLDFFIHKNKINPKNIFIALGPSIKKENYPNNRQTFNEFINQTKSDQIFPFLDVKKAILDQIKTYSIPSHNIENIKICTFEDSNFFSYREDATTNRQISFIRILK